MNFFKRNRGPYICFKPVGEFSAGLIVNLKKELTDELKDSSSDFALDMRKISKIDVTGIRFISNFEKALSKEDRMLVLFGCQGDIGDSLKDIPCKMYATLEEFERGFHEMSSESRDHYLELSDGTGSFRNLALTCPICKSENVKGFLLDESQFEIAWLPDRITPKWSLLDNDENEMDWDMYQVAVCPSCYFASSRIDWFEVKVPEGNIESSLSIPELERISNQVHQRRELEIAFPDMENPHFFAMPRESRAAYVSWKLNEITLRSIAKDRLHTDSFDITMSNFHLCRFAEVDEQVDEHMNTGFAWLNALLDNQSHYSTLRIVQAYCFMISIYLTKSKLTEAMKLLTEFEEKFGDDDENEFWIQRARDLIAEEREDRNII